MNLANIKFIAARIFTLTVFMTLIMLSLNDFVLLDYIIIGILNILPVSDHWCIASGTISGIYTVLNLHFHNL